MTKCVNGDKTLTSSSQQWMDRASNSAARIIVPLSSGEVIRNLAFILCRVVIADRCWLHRAAEFVLKTLRIGAVNWSQPPSLDGKLLVVEGYTHSGNSFLSSNILSTFRDKVVSHIHLQWSLRRCLSCGVPTVLLIREPLEACLSQHFRSVARHNYRMTISLISALLVWLAYHRCAWHYREQLQVVTFRELVSDYGSVRSRVEAWSGVRMSAVATFEGRNEFEGERPAMRLSFVSRVLLKMARRRYRQFASLARVQRSKISTVTVPSRPISNAKAYGGEPAYWRSFWTKSQSLLLCGFVLLEVLADWFCSREIGFGGFGLVDITGAVFGFVVLVKAISRLDYVERAGSRLLAHQALWADWDAVVRIVAAILFILPGVGGDVVGALLLLPLIRHPLVTRLAAVTIRTSPLVFDGSG